MKIKMNSFEVETVVYLMQRMIKADMPATPEDVAHIMEVMGDLSKQYDASIKARTEQFKYDVELKKMDYWKTVWNTCNICLNEGFINNPPVPGLFDNNREVNVAQNLLEELAPKLEMFYANVEESESPESLKLLDSETPDSQNDASHLDNPTKEDATILPLRPMNGPDQSPDKA